MRGVEGGVVEEVVAREGFGVCVCGEVGLLVGCVFFLSIFVL